MANFAKNIDLTRTLTTSISNHSSIPGITTCQCPLHDVTYHSNERKCPVCVQEAYAIDLRATIKDLRNQLARQHEVIKDLQTDVDLIRAMRSAMEILGDLDKRFLKSVLYRRRIHGDISLKVTHSHKDRKPVVNGFLALPRHSEPEAYLCTSIGGVALAGFYEEALNAEGGAKALKMLAMAFSAELHGGHP